MDARTDVLRRGAGGPGGDGPRDHEPLEWADAGALRVEGDHLLASPGRPDPEQAPLRPVRRALGPALAAPHDRALAAADPRGTREVPRRHAQPLRPFPAPRRPGAPRLSA